MRGFFSQIYHEKFSKYQHLNHFGGIVCDISHLPLLQKYIETVRKTIPLCGADGRALHLHNVPSLKVFCRSYGISIGDASLKHDILRLIDEERSVRVQAFH
jgi:hypothetical protein